MSSPSFSGTPGTIAADTTPPSLAVRMRCLRVLTAIIDTAVIIAKRVETRYFQLRVVGAPDYLRGLAIDHFCSLGRAIRYVCILETKLEANAAYRGEPARPTRPVPAIPPIPKPVPAKPARPRKRPDMIPFERVFAGRSIGQIVESLRRTIGLAGPIGPWFDEMLTQPQPTAEAAQPATPPITIRPAILRATAMPIRPTPPPHNADQAEPDPAEPDPAEPDPANPNQAEPRPPLIARWNSRVPYARPIHSGIVTT